MYAYVNISRSLITTLISIAVTVTAQISGMPEGEIKSHCMYPF